MNVKRKTELKIVFHGTVFDEKFIVLSLFFRFVWKREILSLLHYVFKIIKDVKNLIKFQNTERDIIFFWLAIKIKKKQFYVTLKVHHVKIGCFWAYNKQTLQFIAIYENRIILC